MRLRLRSLAPALLLLAACYVDPGTQAQTTYPQQPQGTYVQTQGGAYVQTQPQGYVQQGYAQGGTCEGACQHYLGCKGIADAASFQNCVLTCRQIGYTPTDLASFTQMDCPSAVAAIDGSGGGSGGGGGGGGSGGSSACNGCVRDGSDCVWVSQSNWGTGNNSPYSGAVTSCDPSCCGL